MNLFQLLPIALGAALSQSVSFRVGGAVVSASNNGKPVHFTAGQALVAAEEVLMGQTGSFQVGSVLVTVAKGA
jgi:hypothetical protein